MSNEPPRKSWRETIPGYLAGFAAVATAAVSVLTFLSHRDGERDRESADTPVAESALREAAAAPRTDVNRATPPADAAAAIATTRAAAAAPTLEGALRPDRCAPYLGGWRLSSGELLTFFDGERFEIAPGAAGAPRFGRWTCSGRNGESLYVTPERERTIVFTLAPDGARLYQRTTKAGVTPLEAARESAP